MHAPFSITRIPFLSAALLMLTFLGYLSPDAMAALPTANDAVLPDSIVGADVMTQGAQLTELLFKWGAVVIGIGITLGSVASIYRSFKERQKGDNEAFATTLGGGLLMIVLGLGIAILGYSYAAGLAAQVMALG